MAKTRKAEAPATEPAKKVKTTARLRQPQDARKAKMAFPQLKSAPSEYSTTLKLQKQPKRVLAAKMNPQDSSALCHADDIARITDALLVHHNNARIDLAAIKPCDRSDTSLPRHLPTSADMDKYMDDTGLWVGEEKLLPP